MALANEILHSLLALLGIYLMWRIPSFLGRWTTEQRSEACDNVPSVSIIIPARNEAARIGPLLRSLAQQNLRPLEVIVVDDGSHDGTAEVSRELGARVIDGKPLPEDWSGKNWACWQGARRTIGDLLVFLDADTWLTAPDGLQQIVSTHQRLGGLLTVQPYHVTCRLYEELSAFFNVVLMAGINSFTPHGVRLQPAGSFGPCVVTRRQQYMRTGGHAAVQRAILESLPLAQRYMQLGYPIHNYGGRGAIAFRMYPGGLGQLVEGWSKGFGTGALAIRWTFVLLIAAWISGLFGVWIGLLRATIALEPIHMAINAGAYALIVLQLRWILTRIGSFRWLTALLFPIPLCFFALVMLWSLINIHLLHRIRWHGRTVQTKEDRAGKGSV
jgi:4,4'-diaponeurosporenoate glycosyltransferase